MDRTDLDIPESTVWPDSDSAPQAPVASEERLEEEGIDTGSPESTVGADAADSSGEQSPSLDLDDDNAGRGPKL
jgi:hypothetical protein